MTDNLVEQHLKTCKDKFVGSLFPLKQNQSTPTHQFQSDKKYFLGYFCLDKCSMDTGYFGYMIAETRDELKNFEDDFEGIHMAYGFEISNPYESEFHCTEVRQKMFRPNGIQPSRSHITMAAWFDCFQKYLPVGPRMDFCNYRDYSWLSLPKNQGGASPVCHGVLNHKCHKCAGVYGFHFQFFGGLNPVVPAFETTENN